MKFNLAINHKVQWLPHVNRFQERHQKEGRSLDGIKHNNELK